jgi:hypothetical protein
MAEPLVPLRRPKNEDSNTSAQANATIVSLVRNEELDGMIYSMRQLERSWNSKFNYPWTFFNNVPFTEEFKRRTQAETNAKCRYGRYSLSSILNFVIADIGYQCRTNTQRALGYSRIN